MHSVRSRLRHALPASEQGMADRASSASRNHDATVPRPRRVQCVQIVQNRACKLDRVPSGVRRGQARKDQASRDLGGSRLSRRGAYRTNRAAKDRINDELVFDAIHELREQRGMSPTVREIANSTGLSASAVLTCVARLEDAGAIEDELHDPTRYCPLRTEAYA